jgi:hypothetical protein
MSEGKVTFSVTFIEGMDMADVIDEIRHNLDIWKGQGRSTILKLTDDSDISLFDHEGDPTGKLSIRLDS